MHMADALISPAVGTAFLAVSAAVGSWSVHRLRRENNDERIPLMGVMGAFVFTAQMINFSIPGTGSSGHLGGGLLLAAILGPYGAFLTIAAILTVQALFFGDGGLLALGCNIFNIGFFPCFVAWPLIFKPLMGSGASRKRTFWGAVAGAVLALQAGAFSVVLQTVLSGRTELPFGTFTLLMQPIHLAIGLVEGLVTAAIVLFMLEHRPETLHGMGGTPAGVIRLRRNSAVVIAVLALVTGTVFSSFASGDPDGLEWSLMQASGLESLESDSVLHGFSAALQNFTALLPEYGFKAPAPAHAAGPIDTGKSLSGLVGGAVTLLFLTAAGMVLRKKHKHLPAGENQELP